MKNMFLLLLIFVSPSFAMYRALPTSQLLVRRTASPAALANRTQKRACGASNNLDPALIKCKDALKEYAKAQYFTRLRASYKYNGCISWYKGDFFGYCSAEQCSCEKDIAKAKAVELAAFATLKPLQTEVDNLMKTLDSQAKQAAIKYLSDPSSR